MRVWDHMAGRLSQFVLPEAASNFTMDLIARHQMVREGTQALDVGCGAGKYAIALQKQGAQVTAIDFSGNMLEQAKLRAQEYQTGGINFLLGDWVEVEPAEKGWSKAFDLTLASMTPAVHAGPTFDKLIDTCRGWLLMTKACRRSNSITDRLRKLLFDTESATDEADTDVFYAFRSLWERGMFPQLDYEQRRWRNRKTLAEAIPFFTDRIESKNYLTDVQKVQLAEYLSLIARDGFVEEITHATVVAIYCYMA